MSDLAPVISLAAYRPAPAGFSGEPWVDKATVARHFSVTTTTVDNWCREDGMPFRYVGARRRFQLGACEAWHETQRETGRR